MGGSIDDPNLDIEEIARLHAVNVGCVFATTRAAVAFLASQEASYITGATLTVDGGFLAKHLDFNKTKTPSDIVFRFHETNKKPL